MNRQPSMGWGPGRGPARPNPPQPRAPSPPDPPEGEGGGGGGGILPALQSQADKMIAVASHSSAAVLGHPPSASSSTSTSLEDLVCRLHAQESIRDTRSSHLNLATNLLHKLVTSPNISLSRLVITLHPGDEGYSLSLHNNQGAEMELARYGYEDTEILDSIDSQEIPVTVMDLITDMMESGDTGDLYQGNCVVCEVRDTRLRRSSRPKPHLVLLRPTTQSIICDSLSITRPCQTSQTKWSPEDRVNLESQLLLASGSPLCLDPSPVVSLIAGKMEHSRRKFSSLPLRRHAVKRYSQAGHNRKRKLESLAAPPELALHDFIRKKQNQAIQTQTSGSTPGKRKLGAAECIKSHQDSVQARVRVAEMTNWTQGCLDLASPDTRLAVPAQVDVQKFVRPLARKPETTDMTPQLDSEYVLETAERGQSRIYHTKLTILKRAATEEYLGELYVERDYREDDKKGSTCRFELGTLTNANRYINQFTEIFTEEGRKNVKITHKVPNQPPRVSYTPGMRASMTQAQQQQLQQQLAAQQQAAAAGGAASPSSAAILQKKQLVTSQPQLQLQVGNVSNVTNGAGAKVVSAGAGVPAGTITVSTAQGQVALQLQQQGAGGKIVPQLVQQRLGQQVQMVPAGAAGPSQQSTVQVVQQLNTSGQVVHQVLQTLPQGHLVQQQPAVSGAGQPTAAGQILQTSMGQLTALVPTSIASKLPTAPIARPDLPTSSSTTLQHQPLQQPQAQQLQPGKPKAGETEAISAIVQSLMREGNQFEFEAKKRAEQEQRHGSLPSPGVTQPQLPTVPVPPASLAAVSAAGSGPARVSIAGHQLSVSCSQSAGGQHMVVVTSTAGASQHVSQLAAQLARPSSTLPTYSQAISGGQLSGSGLQTSPLRRQSEAAGSPAANQLSLPSPATAASPSCEGGSGALSALLADTPAADKPLPPGLAASSVSSNSLLERLVSGGQHQTVSSNSNLSPAASQLPSVQHAVGGGSGLVGATSNGSTSTNEEITLQSLLSHPPAKVQSPNKVSPLLQQLQQPVQSATSPRTSYPTLTSPRHHPPASPRPGVTSPRPAQSPRSINPPTSPAVSSMSALQQQLMQPPAPRYPVTTHSILSAHLTAPPRNSSATATAAGQPGMMIVSNNTQQHQAPTQQVVSVALPEQNGANAVATGGQTVQLVQQSQQPVQLVSAAAGQQVQLVQQNQPQVQLVNHHVNNTVQLVQNNSGPAGGQPGQVQLVNQQVQLVNQAGTAGGQQIMVGNVPMQLSISPQVQFSVNLANSSQSNSIATLANGVNPPILVSGAGQPGTVTVTSMANLGKLVSNGPNGAPTTVLLQGQPGNILLPSGVKQVPAGGQTVMRQGQVMTVRQAQPQQTPVLGQQSSPVLVQLPSGQRIVQQVSLNPGNINCNIVNKSGIVTPSASGPTATQIVGSGGGVSPAPNSIPQTATSPQSSSMAPAPTGPPESQMLVQLSNHQSDGVSPHFLLANTNQKSGLVSQQMMTGSLNQSTLNNKLRQQRKQSLK